MPRLSLRPATAMRLLLWAVLCCGLAACASMGRPEGGARDEDPPVFMRSDPAPGATGVTRTRMQVYFDENVQLEDAFTKVVVSPAQKTPPQISANGRQVTVNFRDTLRPNTTYTVDFADAIKDLNEGNILDGFALDFSTGDTIDTLRISGMVLQADNLEPAQGMLVGVYSNLSDTALTTLPMERIARTNQYGQFTIRNLPQGKYRIFAINDVNRDYHWDRSEDIAFSDSLYVPTTETFALTDTLYAADGTDSLVHREGIRYLPNDVLLTWFNVGYKAPYLADYKRPERRKITLNFGAPQDSLPTLTIVDGAPGPGRPDSLWALRHTNATGDSLLYWIADTAVVASDSLRLAVRYQKLDSLEQKIWASDTLRFFFRDTDKKKKKDKKKDDDKPRFTVDTITGDTTWLPPADMEYLLFKAVTSAQHDLNKPVVVEHNLPLAHLDTAGIHLTIKDDTLWNAIPFVLRTDSLDPLLRFRLDMPWQAGATYRLEVDTLAATSIYGPWNKPFRHEFTVKNPEDYSNLLLTLPGLDSVQTVVELLNSSDKPLYTVVKPEGTAQVAFRFVNPGTYYARLTVDANRNGKWDTGSPLDSVQPEEVYYFAKKLDLRKNWDVEQTWDITELPLDLQKPYAIKKNKPKLKRGEEAPKDEDDSEDNDLYDPFGSQNGRGGAGNRRQGGGGNYFPGGAQQRTGLR